MEIKYTRYIIKVEFYNQNTANVLEIAEDYHSDLLRATETDKKYAK